MDTVEPIEGAESSHDPAADAASIKEWRSKLQVVFDSAAAALPSNQRPMIARVSEQVLAVVEALQTTELARNHKAMESLRFRVQWEKEQAKKQLGSLRSASTMEGQHLITRVTMQLEAEHKNTLEQMEQKAAEVTKRYEAQIGAQAEVQQVLLMKITLLDGGATAASLEHERQVSFMAASAMRRLQHVALSRGWLTWVEGAAEQRKMHGALRRMRDYAVNLAFHAWVELCEQRESQRQLMEQAARRLLRPALTSAFTHWLEEWKEAQRRVTRDGLLMRIEELESQIMRERIESARRLDAAVAEQQRLLHTMTLGQSETMRLEALARADLVEYLNHSTTRRRLHQARMRSWGAWKEFRQARATQRRRLSQFVSRWLKRQLVRGWAEWHVWARMKTSERRCMGAVVGRLANKHLSRGWTGWHSCWEEGTAHRRMMRGALSHHTKKQLTGCWGSWHELRHEAARKRQLLAVAASRLRNPSLAGAYGVWRHEWRRALMAEHANILEERARLFGPKGDKDGEIQLSETTSPPLELAERTLSPLELAERKADELSRALQEMERWRDEERGARELAKAEAQMATEMLVELDGLRNESSRWHAEREALQAKLDETVRQLTREIEHARADYERRGRDLAAAKLHAELAADVEKEAKETLEKALEAVARADEVRETEKRQLTRRMYEQMEGLLAERMDAVAVNHEHRIRELTNLLALRDRQLMRAVAGATSGNLGLSRSSPAMPPFMAPAYAAAATPGTALHKSASESASPKPLVRGSGDKRSLDLRPVNAPVDDLRMKRPATAAYTTNASRRGRGQAAGMALSTSSAGLLVTATLPEAVGWAGQMARVDAQPLGLTIALPIVPTRDITTPHLYHTMTAPGGSMMGAKSAPSWTSPFSRRCGSQA